jgi:hypothetical protein
VNRSETYQSSALRQFLLCSSLPRLQAAVEATAIAADDVDEKARFPSEAIELVKETKFEAQTLRPTLRSLCRAGTVLAPNQRTGN